MKDRVPVYPGRVKLVPVSGQENVYDMTRADQPTQQGDPLNKATLLKDATAALFGLGADAVPDDVLAFLGKYNQYWWRRRINTVGWTVKTSEQSVNSVWVSYNDADGNIEYSSEIDISDGGVVSLKNPSSASFNKNRYSNLNVVKGKYWTCDTTSLEDAGILYTPSNAPNAKLRSYGDYDAIEMQYGKVTSEYTGSIGEWEYSWSPDRNTYPDSGISESYEYQFLGIPLSNAVTAPQIATGSYVGTGKYGPDNPNSLTFEFPPKLLFITQYNDDGNFYGANSIDRNPMDCSILTTSYTAGLGFSNVSSSDGLSGYAKKTEDGKTITWYHSSSASSQANYAQRTYYYFAIG